MKIKAKYVNEPIVAGVTRLRRKFAWLPHRIGDVFVLWEYYDILEAWLETPVILQIKGKPATFTLAQWTAVSERLIP